MSDNEGFTQEPFRPSSVEAMRKLAKAAKELADSLEQTENTQAPAGPTLLNE